MNQLKSRADDLKKRGMAGRQEIEVLSHATYEQLLEALLDKEASLRSAAAVNLQKYVDQAADDLLKCLVNEKSLYTKIAICQCLEKGNRETAEKMTHYLGLIGNNQYKTLPDKTSAKKSYPLPRDIIARSLGRMNPEILPVLITVLKSGEAMKIREIMDGLGFLVFYNSSLGNRSVLDAVLHAMEEYREDEIIRWKVLTCLSAFHQAESISVLQRHANEPGVLGMEARRSIRLLGQGGVSEIGAR